MYTVFCEKRDAVLNIKRGFKKSWKTSHVMYMLLVQQIFCIHVGNG